MSWAAVPYVLPLALGTAVALVTAIAAWRRREIPGAAALGWTMAGTSIWSGFTCVELLIPDLGTQVIMGKIEYVGIAIASTAWLLAGAATSGRAVWLRHWGWLVPAGVSLVTLALLWSGDPHGLVWASVGQTRARGFPDLIVVHGTWWWVNAVFAYLALLGGTALILTAMRRHRRATGAEIVVVILAVLVLVGGLPNALGMSQRIGLDLTPFGVTLGGLVVAWCHFRLRFLDVFLNLVPVANDAVVAGMDDGLIVIDNADMVVSTNPAARRLFGFDADHIYGEPLERFIGRPFPSVTPDDLDGPRPLDFAVASPDGPRYYEARTSRLFRAGFAAGRAVVLRDVTQRKRAEGIVRESEQRFRTVVEQSHDGIYMLAPDGAIVLYNRAMERILGYSRAEAQAAKLAEILFPNPGQRSAALAVTMDHGELDHASFATETTRKDGKMVWLQICVSRVVLDGQDLILGTITDVTEQKRRERHLAFLASHDSLTGLPNRQAFEHVLADYLARQSVEGTAAVLFIDLDHFKEINDTAGHAAGDAALSAVARLVGGHLRPSDVLARIGGDEFVALLADVDVSTARDVAERLRAIVEEARIGENLGGPGVTLSIGVAPLNNCVSTGDLLSRADAAMYAAKRSGRDRVILDASEMSS